MSCGHSVSSTNLDEGGLSADDRGDVMVVDRSFPPDINVHVEPTMIRRAFNKKLLCSRDNPVSRYRTTTVNSEAASGLGISVKGDEKCEAAR